MKSTGSSAPTNGSNGPTSTADSTPASGTATPTATRGPAVTSIPGQHVQQLPMVPSEMLPRKEMKKPLPDILKEINKKSKAKITMRTGAGGTLHFTSTGPFEATQQSLKDLTRQIGSKVSGGAPIVRNMSLTDECSNQ
jgi:hypothetical protein